MTGVLAAGDQLTCAGLRAILGVDQAFSPLAEARDRAELDRALVASCPLVVVLDAHSLGSELESSIRLVRQRRPSAPLLVLLETPELAGAEAVLRAGATACLGRAVPAVELLATARLLACGHAVVPALLAERLLCERSDGESDKRPTASLSQMPLPSWRARLGLLPRQREYLLVGLIVVGALLVRTWRLGTVPYGLQGDEASVGLEAERILQTGWIGPFSPLALGMPAGPIYLTAIAVAALGNTITAVRLAPALLGSAAVAVFYLMLRRAYGGPCALVGAVLLTCMEWMIHFSRLAIPNASWAPVALLGVASLNEAIARRAWRWWLLAGAASGLGLYVYQAHTLYLIVVGFFLVGRALLGWSSVSRVDFGRYGGFLLGFSLVMLPMALYLVEPANRFIFSSFPLVSVLTKPEWLGLESRFDRLQFLVGRYAGFWDQLCCHPIPNPIDGSGATPVVPPAMLLLAVVGIALALVRQRGPLTLLALAIVLIMPLGSVLTIEGPFRRSNALAPFLALFAAVGTVELWRLARFGHGWSFRAAAAGLVGIIALIGQQNLEGYFVRFETSSNRRFTFAQEFTEATWFMKSLPAGSRVYFYCERWSFNYEIRRFLAPEVAGEDQSNQFGGRGQVVESAKGAPVFIFFGQYQSLLPQAEARYPGGEVMIFGNESAPDFVAYGRLKAT